MPKCQHPGGIVIKPDGIHELDPCVYKLAEIHENVTVMVKRCPKCGTIDISWTRQDNTEDIIFEELKE